MKKEEETEKILDTLDSWNKKAVSLQVKKSDLEEKILQVKTKILQVDIQLNTILKNHDKLLRQLLKKFEG